MLINFPARRATRQAFQAAHYSIPLRTRECLQFIDLTDELASLVAASGVINGTVNVQSRHTTAAVVVNEDEPLLLEDLKRTLERLAPRGADYRHDDFSVRTANLTPDEQPNGHAHCKALALRASETINVVNGELQLGRWQRVFFVELDCARAREVSVLVMGAA
jgi:secondary thiamine-phosphate synthase enzyme